MLDLLRSYAVFKLSGIKGVVRLAPSVLNFVQGTKLENLCNGVIRNTFYNQFCGGETIEDVSITIEALRKKSLHCILDYAAESSSCEGNSLQHIGPFYESINLAKDDTSHRTRVALKLSAFFPYEMLLSIAGLVTANQNIMHLNLIDLFKQIPNFQKHFDEMQSLFKLAYDCEVTLMVDAENLAILPATDYLTLLMMEQYNKENIHVVNTYQMYLSCALKRLEAHFIEAKTKGYFLGLKIVRGAYINSDGGVKFSSQYGPILGSIEETHLSYNSALRMIFTDWINEKFDATIATHNEYSIDDAINHTRPLCSTKQRQFSFAQLYGMRDDLSEKIVKNNLVAYKYLPFGPVSTAIPYLLRRALENQDVLKTSVEIESLKRKLKSRLTKFTGTM